MNCPNCGTANEPGRKFCGECGTKLAAVCGTCGTAKSQGRRSAPAEPRPEIRVSTPLVD